MPDRLLLFPYCGNTREALMVIQDINKHDEQWDVVGFLDDNPDLHDTSFYNVKVLGGSQSASQYPDAKILAVPGSPDTYLNRKEYIAKFGNGDDQWATIVHPSADVASDAKIGSNTLIMPGVVISPEVTIGAHCVILPNTVISHNSSIGDYCCLGSNVSISGDVTVEENCYIGTGVSIKNGLTIGRRSMVGIGSNVVANVDPETVVAGNPAKFMRGVSR